MIVSNPDHDELCVDLDLTQFFLSCLTCPMIRARDLELLDALFGVIGARQLLQVVADQLIEALT